MSKIKSVKAYKSEVNEESSYLLSLIEYDEKGNVITSIAFMDDGEVESKTIAVYDEKGNKIEESEYLDESNVGEYSKYYRDEKGELIKVEKKFSEGYESLVIYERDNGKKSLVVLTNDEDGELEEKEEFTYTDDGKLLSKGIYDYNGKLVQLFDNEYDSNGQLIAQTEYGKKKEFILETQLDYDDKGNVTSQISLNRKGKVAHRIFLEYDEKNRVVEQKYGKEYVIKTEYDDEKNTQFEQRIHSNGITENETLSSFNTEGNIIEENDGFAVTKYEYEYFE